MCHVEHMQIALVLVDEVHVLNECRGSALEVGTISRIKMLSEDPDMKQVGRSCQNKHEPWPVDVRPACTG